MVQPINLSEKFGPSLLGGMDPIGKLIYIDSIIPEINTPQLKELIKLMVKVESEQYLEIYKEQDKKKVEGE